MAKAGREQACVFAGVLNQGSSTMCGIYGVVGQIDEPDFVPAARMLSARGPDAFGTYHDRERRVHLAHCRLAIIDLSSAGNQPMRNEAGDVWIVFNGEIYNFRELRPVLEKCGHVFRSQTDTEVIVHAYEEWGEECVSRLAGMFAFAIWDARKNRLFLARDRIGIKPLYYHAGPRFFAFASEPKAIVALPGFERKVHPRGLVDYLVYGYLPGDESIWSGISKLLPGHALTFDLASGRARRHRYWNLEPEILDWHPLAAQERLSELLSGIITEHMVSDVPLGLFLSGGLDSTLIASYAAAGNQRAFTFSLGFTRGKASELPVARETAHKLNTEHCEEIVDPARFNHLRGLLRYLDEPLGNNAIFPNFAVAEAGRRHVTVALTGDGGDEVFGGYEWFTQIENCRWTKRALFQAGSLGRCLGLGKTHWGRRANLFNHYLMLKTPGFGHGAIKALFPALNRGDFPESETWYFEQYWRPGLGRYKRWQYLDLMTFLPGSNLKYSDRASMANSMEVRAPLLDHRLVEFAFSLPDHLCVRGKSKKHLLRRLLARRGMRHVLRHPKQGFSTPVGAFWSGAQMLDQLRGGALARDGLLHLPAVEKLGVSYGLWLLAMLETWYSNWVVPGKITPPEPGSSALCPPAAAGGDSTVA